MEDMQVGRSGTIIEVMRNERQLESGHHERRIELDIRDSHLVGRVLDLV
jgi:hypothetical protein